jgi:hypothetical protein
LTYVKAFEVLMVQLCYRKTKNQNTMKKILSAAICLLLTASLNAQTKENRFAISTGASIHHYNGNLGNSLFQFGTTCFAGTMTNLGFYLNKSFDLQASYSNGVFGYCQTNADKTRLVIAELRCPGCTDRLGMGELRASLSYGALSVAYKFANGYILKERSLIAPYIYAGAGLSFMSDAMGKKCVNIGNHYAVTGGTGFKVRISGRLYAGYNLGMSCFIGKKVYASEGSLEEAGDHNEEAERLQKRPDLLIQNTAFVGIVL